MATLFLHGRLLAFPGELHDGKTRKWVWRNPVAGYVAYFLLAIVACLNAAPVRADKLPSLSWSCWASGQSVAKINCIHERSQPPQTVPKDADSELEAQVLGQLYEKKKSDGANNPEGFEWQGIDILHEGARWTINVNSSPYGTLEGSKPDKVARAVLCPSDTPCTVTLHKTVQGEAAEAK